MPRIVLIGCGHAHLEVLRRGAALRKTGAELVIIDPGKFWYSGLGGGVLGGRVSEREATVDPQRLADVSGAVLLADRLVALDTKTRQAHLASGGTVAYDIVSLNLGSETTLPAALAGSPHLAAKPIAGFVVFREILKACRSAQHIVVLGGGATGCELAGNLLYLGRANALQLDVTIVTAADMPLPNAPQELRRRVAESLVSRGATIVTGVQPQSAGGGGLRLRDGRTLAFDHLVTATGLTASRLVGQFGLPESPNGLRVTTTLQSIADRAVFAAGDCAAIEGYDLPKLGVYGVRAGRVLAHNLLATLTGSALEAYRPQRHALSILDLADGKGYAMRGRFWFAGRAAWLLKDRLDQEFLERYRGVYEAGQSCPKAEDGDASDL